MKFRALINTARELVLAALFCLVGQEALAQSVEQFYRDKSVRVVIGYGVGGGYDLNARLAARHLGRHLPGNPTFVPQNMPGASGMTATGFLYLSAPKDGTAIGTVPVNMARDQVLKGKDAKFDVRKFFWIGRMVSGAGTHFTWHESGLKSFSDLKTREFVAAGTGPTGNSVIYPRVTNALMGTRIKILKGFKGTSESTLALQRGEVHLVLEPWQSIKSGNADMVRDKKIVLVVQYASRRHPDLQHVPTIMELCETDEQRKLFTLLLSSAEIGRSLVMPPGVPTDRATAMRIAFDRMMKDPELLRDAEKQRMDLDMLGGEELEKLVLASFDSPPDVVDRLRELLAQK
jgi:tripartite-type tricarboxylate transporter receptor subunit TctC